MKEQGRNEETFARVLEVCRSSGYRKWGIQKRIQENENFLRCIENAGEPLWACPWFGDAVRSIQIFFQNLQDIMGDGNTSCNNVDIIIDNLIKMCGEYGENLRNVQNINRLLLIIIQNIPCISNKIAFSESWIEDHELFFEDFRQAMKPVFKSREFFESVYPWVGRDHSAVQLFNTIKFY